MCVRIYIIWAARCMCARTFVRTYVYMHICMYLKDWLTLVMLTSVPTDSSLLCFVCLLVYVFFFSSRLCGTIEVAVTCT